MKTEKALSGKYHAKMEYSGDFAFFTSARKSMYHNILILLSLKNSREKNTPQKNTKNLVLPINFFLFSFKLLCS